METSHAGSRLWTTTLVLIGLSLGCALMQQPTPIVLPTPSPTPAVTTPASETLPGVTPTLHPTVTATATPGPSPSSTPTSEPPTATTAPPTPTWTPEPTPTATLPPDADRITFAPGATSATISGNLPGDTTQTYVLGIAAGQLIEVTVDAAATPQMEIRGIDGVVVKPEGPPFFRGTVPSSQDYLLTVVAPPGGVAYTLNAIIPVRITFEPGATTARLEATIPPFTTRHYVIRVLGGQTMTFDTTATQGEVIAIVFGADGTVLQTDHAGAPDFEGPLPSTQDYLINLRSVGAVSAILTIDVTIPPPE